ncbi:hypothetical protein L7F22_064614 [Adiantum nelumboides]|nr:hypothetical protein [Adiantum nelumboides]
MARTKAEEACVCRPRLKRPKLYLGGYKVGCVISTVREGEAESSEGAGCCVLLELIWSSVGICRASAAAVGGAGSNIKNASPAFFTQEMQKGDEVAWFPNGDTIVRYKVFGPVTTTRQVYDSVARLVVRGTMEGVNGTVFAYEVTSSGKTHTMHGDQKSPGIIRSAIKDVFSFIQDTPGREYLLRVSYLEIYNEVITDLLNPTTQNLRIREDAQGTYVEGVKEEVSLSPAHALSLIAAGEEHRHVGSNNFNLVSSRSHTIFTLTIESSSRSPDNDDKDVSLSLLVSSSWMP